MCKIQYEVPSTLTYNENNYLITFTRLRLYTVTQRDEIIMKTLLYGFQTLSVAVDHNTEHRSK